jgi:ATP-dependent Lon protease
MDNASTDGRAYPVVPLRKTVLFPFQQMPLAVSRSSSVAALEAALESEDKTLVVVAQKDATLDTPSIGDLFEVGTLAVVKRMRRAGNMLQAIVEDSSRVRLHASTATQPFLTVTTEILSDPADSSPEAEALYQEVANKAARALALLQVDTNVPMELILQNVTGPMHLVYVLGGIFSMTMEQEQSLLAAQTQLDALGIMHKFLSHEVQVLELRQQIASQAESEMGRQQREYLLRQQLQAIQKELGEQNPRRGRSC